MCTPCLLSERSVPKIEEDHPSRRFLIHQVWSRIRYRYSEVVFFSEIIRAVVLKITSQKNIGSGKYFYCTGKLDISSNVYVNIRMSHTKVMGGIVKDALRQ